MDDVLLDNSELTLDLIHILELIDSPTSHGKILGLGNGVIQKLERFGDAVRILHGTDRPYDSASAAAEQQALQARIDAKDALLKQYQASLDAILCGA